MKREVIKIPQWLAIVGQSGAGKGSATKILRRLLKKLGIKFLFISTGDLIRECIETQTYLAKKMHKLNNQGKRQPDFVAASLWFSKMLHELEKGQIIIHEGAPRSSGQFSIMKSLVDAGYIKSMKILEILVPDSVCRKRLITRTRKYGRSDLSVNGKPGTPDINKINTKMSWWSKDRKKIIEKAKKAGMYLIIKNTGTIPNLEKKLIELFQIP